MHQVPRLIIVCEQGTPHHPTDKKKITKHPYIQLYESILLVIQVLVLCHGSAFKDVSTFQKDQNSSLRKVGWKEPSLQGSLGYTEMQNHREKRPGRQGWHKCRGKGRLDNYLKQRLKTKRIANVGTLALRYTHVCFYVNSGL